VFDIYTIVFLAVAVFIFLRLRSVLGQRTGRERPPYDPFSRDPVRGAAKDTAKDNVVALPGRPLEPTANVAEPAAAADRWKGIAETGSATATGLDAIVAADPEFDPKHFIAGARAAYEMVVTAYAEGDRRALKNLLSRDVYDGFDVAIAEREKRGEKAESRFVSIDTAEIVGAEMRAKSAQVTVRFVSQLISVTRDKNGVVIDGNPEKVTEVTDVWTFARDISSRDPNWKLIATEAGQ
jgi:predicted lipid-binding transport protein (Tim44 family)